MFTYEIIVFYRFGASLGMLGVWMIISIKMVVYEFIGEI